MKLKAYLKQGYYGLWIAVQWLSYVCMPLIRQRIRPLNRYLLALLVIIATAIPAGYYFAPINNDQPNEAVLASQTLTLDDQNVHSEDSTLSSILDVPESSAKLPQSASEHAEAHSHTTYICPMHPEIVSEKFGSCPICGMDLVEFEDNGDADVVQLSTTVINTLGVRTVDARKRTLYRRIDSVGYVTYDENKIHKINLRTEGWVENLAINAVGDRVKKGDLLFEVYSPKLVNAQEEYVQAMALGNKGLLDASRKRLRALGVSNVQINKLKKKKVVEQLIKIYAPQDGVVSELSIREGMYVPPSTTTISLVDLSSVWFIADVFERQADWIEVGLRAKASLPFMPDKVWEGSVDHIYPSLDAVTRSLKARIRIDNPGELLKPNMYADVSIYAKPKRKALVVPRETVIRTGEEERVILALGEGRFKPTIVHSGIETDDYIEITMGLEVGDKVVVSSQFLIDSESSLRASMTRIGG